MALYDARGNLALASNAVSRAFFEHDAFDNPIVVSDGWLSVTNKPDAFGRPLQIQHPDGLAETFARNASGAVTSATDRAGQTADFTYELGRLATASAYLDNGSGPSAAATESISYDWQMDAKAITDTLTRPAESYALDAQGRVKTVTNMEGQTMTINYLIGPLMASVTRFDGVVVTNIYDSSANLVSTKIIGSPALDTQMTFRPNGQPLTISNPSSQIALGYDAYGRADSWTHTFQSAYSAAARHDSGAASYDNDGNATNSVLTFGTTQSPQSIANTYSYDSAGRLDSMSSTAGGVSVSRKYDARGLLASESNNVVATSYAFDSLNRLTNITYRNSASGTQIASFGYTLDSLGRVVQKTTSIGGQTSSDTYAYDTLGRLVAENAATFAYDLAGNRTGAGGTTYSYANNKLTMTGYSHDAAGNMTRKELMEYGWNNAGQLTSMGHMQLPTLRAKYEYDVLGRLASYTKAPDLPAAKTTLYVYDGDQIIADTDKNGELLKTYVWGAGVDNLLAVTVHSGNAQATYYPIKDHLGSVLALVDGSGVIAAQYSYDTCGKALSKTTIPELSDFRYLWQCREYSELGGLYYFRARWHNPQAGRFISKDPIGLLGGMNFYAFCGNDPVNFRDPYGLCPGIRKSLFFRAALDSSSD